LGQAGRQFVAASYDWQRLLPRLQQQYDQLVRP